MKKVLAVVFAAIVLCGVATTTANAFWGMDTDSELVEVGQIFSVTVSLNKTLTHDNNFRNCQGELYYDPDVLTYVSHTMGSGYEDFDSAHISNRNRVQFSKTAANSAGYEKIPAGTVISVMFRANEALTEEYLTSMLDLNISVMPVGADPVQSNCSVTVKICRAKEEVPGQENGEMPGESKTETPADKEGTVTGNNDGSHLIVELNLSEGAIREMIQNDDPVRLPIEILRSSKEDSNSPVVTIITNYEEPVAVEVPVSDVSCGTVVVVLNADGTEMVVSDTKMTENGLVFVCCDGMSVRIINKAREYADINGANWFNNAVDFVSARGIMKGMTENEFVPAGVTTRAQVWVMLARLSGVDTSKNNWKNWYDSAREWAMKNGISDGNDPNGKVTREQLVTMLHRFAGSPYESKSIHTFLDADQVSPWAQAAMEWAYGVGVMNGNADGTLNPKGDTARNQLAQFFMNFIQKI